MKIMKKEDFETVKRRDEMIDKRLKEIKSRKYMVDTRGEICDTKFFLRNKVFWWDQSPLNLFLKNLFTYSEYNFEGYKV